MKRKKEGKRDKELPSGSSSKKSQRERVYEGRTEALTLIERERGGYIVQYHFFSKRETEC